MFRISGVLIIILLVFGFCTEVLSQTSQEKYPHPIFIPFERNCTGNTDKKPSNEAILQILKAHSKWLEVPTVANGYRAKFCEADLREIDFHMAMLAGANFTKAKLQKAQLPYANLTRANFSEAQLQNANLDNAMLHLTILHKAILDGTSLQNAMLYQAKLQGVDLSNVKGLTQNQINMACLNKHTKLPQGLSRPKPCS
jgi:uncharacterized protein YjbI with pentapeptide repeats